MGELVDRQRIARQHLLGGYGPPPGEGVGTLH